MTASKVEWITAIKSLSPTCAITDLREHLESPTFRFGRWKVAVEHLRRFDSVVLRWTGPLDAVPGPYDNWERCAATDRSKGWIYRAHLHPAGLALLVAQLDSEPVALDTLNDEFIERVLQARNGDREARRARLDNAAPMPQRVVVTAIVYDRNPDVVAEVLDRAGGTCEACKKPAPFQRRSDGTPYLEVHHRIPLASGGEDTIENAVAVCPNCHRRAHFA